MTMRYECARDAYFSLKNGSAEVTGDGKRLLSTSISAPDRYFFMFVTAPLIFP